PMKNKTGFVTVWLVLAVLLTACRESPTATPAPVATTAAATTAPKKAALGDDSVGEIKNVTLSGDFTNPLDSTPDLTGANTYFTATGPKGTGVFKVPSAGGAATEVFTGAPFVGARGLAFSPDGQQLFVTDPAATGQGGKAGQIFVLPLNGGAPVAVA